MRALQALVVVMGVLLLAGSAVIAVTLLHRMSAPASHARHETSLPARVNLDLPAEGHVVSAFALGERLAVHLSGADGDAVLLVDPSTGHIDETIRLQASPGSR